LYMIVLMVFVIVVMGAFTSFRATYIISSLTDASMLEVNKKDYDLILGLAEKEAANMDTVAVMKDIQELLARKQAGDTVGFNELQGQVNSRLQSLVKDAGNLEHMFVIDTTGFIIADSDVKLLNADMNSREYTKKTLATQGPVISEILQSKSTGAYIVAFTHPITVDGKFAGFVTSAVYADSIVKYLSDSRIMGTKSSYAYLVDEKGAMLYHPTREKIGKPVDNEQIKDIVAKVQGNAYENSATTQQLSAGMEETAASSEIITATVAEIDGNVGTIAEKAREGSGISNQISQRAVTLKKESMESTDNAKAIYNNVRVKMEKAIQETNTISEISLLPETILGITNQTNLLALNAAIEAARGFAVVDDEIRKLADESSKTASGIQGIVKNVYSSVGQMKESSESILSFIDQNVLADYEKLVKVSEQYSDDAAVVNSLMSEFAVAAEQLSTSVSNISTAMNEVAATINEGAKGVQDIAEKTSDIVEKTQIEVQMADENTHGAKELQTLVEKFRI
ncbi:MAG TPA: methyl-accepting chemotaxis protein, partial [Negativicutes bacterium]|nr:methyl-accepting chemotaxis protein [Negativicutes bacterium]